MKKHKGILGSMISKQNDADVIIMRNVHDLIPNPLNEGYTTNDIDSLAAEIAMTHNIEPITIKAGTNIIISGHRRRLAKLQLLEQGIDKSPLVPTVERKIVNDYTDAGVTDEDIEQIMVIFANKGSRRKLTPSEEAFEIEKTRPIVRKIYEKKCEDGEYKGKFRPFFASYLGMSESALIRKDSINKLSPEIKEAVDSNDITVTAASELAGLSQEEQKKTVTAIKERGEEVTVENVKKEKAKKEATKKNKTDDTTTAVHQKAEKDSAFDDMVDVPEDEIPRDEKGSEILQSVDEAARSIIEQELILRCEAEKIAVQEAKENENDAEADLHFTALSIVEDLIKYLKESYK